MCYIIIYGLNNEEIHFLVKNIKKSIIFLYYCCKFCQLCCHYMRCYCFLVTTVISLLCTTEPWVILCRFCSVCSWFCAHMAMAASVNCWLRSWEVVGHRMLRQWHLKDLLWNPHSVNQTWNEKANQRKGGKQAVGVKCFCVQPGLMTRLLFLLSYYLLFLSSFLSPLPLLLCLFLLSKGFLMTNLSGSASLPISHCGIQLPAHPLMNTPDSKDRADRGEDRWKIQKHTTPPSFTFQDSTPPVSSQTSSFSLFSPPFNLLCHSQLPMVRTT